MKRLSWHLERVCSGCHSPPEQQEAVHPRSTSQCSNWTCSWVFKIIYVLLSKNQMLSLRYLLRLPLRSMKKQDRGIPHPQIVATHILWPISTIFKAPNCLASLSIRGILQGASENSSQSKNFCPSWSLSSLMSSIWQEVQGQSVLSQVAGELIALQRESSIYFLKYPGLSFHSHNHRASHKSDNSGLNTGQSPECSACHQSLLFVSLKKEDVVTMRLLEQVEKSHNNIFINSFKMW